MPVEPWLQRAAARRPERVAIASAGESLTYAQLLAAARAGAEDLAARGIEPGTRVALALPTGLRFAVGLHGCLLAGAVVVPVDVRLAAPERALRMAGAEWVLGEDEVARASAVTSGKPPDEARPSAAPPPDDRPSLTPPARARPNDPPTHAPLAVVHTSGTTGVPRAVVLSHANVLSSALASAAALGLASDERWLCPLPTAHVGGLMILLRATIYATTAVLAPPPFDPDAAARALASGDVTACSLVAPMLRRVLDSGLPPSPRLRVVLLGGGPAEPSLLERARDAGWPVVSTYGLTEACSQVTVSEPGAVEAAGWPLPGVGVELADDGEILVSGPTVSAGSLSGSGLLHTGDFGRFDARGRLVVSGRKDDLIVTGGENVAPSEVEAVLLSHPDVADAAVFGRPDPEWGHAVSALVVARPQARVDPDALRALCRRRLAGFKVPKTVELVPELPRTASGKLLRRLLT